MDVRGRLRYAIRDIADKFGIEDARGTLIALKLSHEDFAELVGASRPMVSKHLKELAAAGVFVKQNARYVLLRVDGLDETATVSTPKAPRRDTPPRLRSAAPRAQALRAHVHRVRVGVGAERALRHVGE
jgi:biotin operon repressor